jgi:hypothetical protein
LVAKSIIDDRNAMAVANFDRETVQASKKMKAYADMLRTRSCLESFVHFIGEFVNTNTSARWPQGIALENDVEHLARRTSSTIARNCGRRLAIIARRIDERILGMRMIRY